MSNCIQYLALTIILLLLLHSKPLLDFLLTLATVAILFIEEGRCPPLTDDAVIRP